MGQWVLSPHTASRALGARRSRSRRDVRQGRMFVPHGFAGANRRRPSVHRGRMFLDVGSNCSASSGSFAASLSFPAAVLASPRSPSFIDETRPVGGAAGRGVSTWKAWGPRCGVSARVAPKRSSKGGLRWDGGGSHRLAVPGRGSCLVAGVSTGSSVTLTRSSSPSDAHCWTQRRPPAGSSR